MIYDSNGELTIPKDAHHAVLVKKSLLRYRRSQDTLLQSRYNLNGQIANSYVANLKTALNGIVCKWTNGAVVVVSSAASFEGMETALNDEVSIF